jgi:CTP-dependent riboflavin kinase
MYSGKVKTGIGGATVEMSKPEDLEKWERLTGLSVIPGTLNFQLTTPFDLSLLRCLNFSSVGWSFDPASQGHDFKGDIGVYYSRITIEDNYPGILAFWTWALDLNRHAELISPVHLRTAMGLADGDMVHFFTLH